jgi:hypothetical protein
VGEILGVNPASKNVVRWFERANPHPTVEAAALRLLHAATQVIDDNGMQSLVAALADIDVPVPMPRFDTAHLDLSFLTRYPQQRRVTLLTDLWYEQVKENTKDAIRVAQEVEDRGPRAAARGAQLRRDIAARMPSLVADLITNEGIASDDPHLHHPRVVEALLASPRTAHLVAFHAAAADPAHALAVLRSTRLMTTERVTTHKDGLPETVARAVVQELTDSTLMRHTHAALQLQNVISLALAATQTLPEAAPLVVKAYSNWTKNASARQAWSASDCSTLFLDRHLNLDRLSAEQLHKAHLEHARLLQRLHDDDARPSGLEHFMSPDILIELECQPNAPTGVRDSCREALTKLGHTHRTPNGRLVTEYYHAYHHEVDSTDLVSILKNAPVKIADRVTEVSRVMNQVMINPENTKHIDTYGSVILSALSAADPAHPGQDGWQASLADAATQQILANVRQLSRAHAGELSLEELGEFKYSNQAWRIMMETSSSIPREVRQHLIKQLGDPDYALVGHILEDQCDLITQQELSSLSTRVHALSLLASRSDVEWASKPKRAAELPTADHLPWEVPSVADRLDKRRITFNDSPLNISVIRDIGALQANAAPNCMGNCTDTHASRLRRGDEILLAIDRGKGTEINVSLHLSNGEWSVTEIKAAQNNTVHPDLAKELTTRLLELVAGTAA